MTKLRKNENKSYHSEKAKKSGIKEENQIEILKDEILYLKDLILIKDSTINEYSEKLKRKFIEDNQNSKISDYENKITLLSNENGRLSAIYKQKSEDYLNTLVYKF